ncbi:RhuM family protein [Tetragenococcus koreensis]|uniref:Toxin Fic n=1 Tax=Tetragenococcus koreensis TaxID=290335 RepID=A0AAN4UB46_9ENTE|nr:RhuM family protein [Tetragenococcus koreensis]AYW44487.1 cell filamentation protein Fic [Tetragenococcus koreensis]MCF1625974.1 virulence RhuM family protein [Tetragenococcus koreensis]MCF1631261.1 virulence RhuM family protein [Tetragenococcus koreensis]MCF1677247.1 virulence RhuM family protein [Tetragenococcus koreensis]MDN6250550.1 virulence RhuM family protein [Tetragenococcus koreensis]
MANEIILYNTEDGQTKVELHLNEGTVWLSELEIAELFQTTRQNINKHIKAIITDGELDEEMVSNYQLLTTKHGAMESKTQTKEVKFYNLDMILAIGYRVRSARGAQFRRYASTVLKEYLIEGAVLDTDKLTDNLTYFKKLQKRIRDIRSSERLFYQQVLDIFATSIDYNGTSEVAREFFQTVQNKMLYAVTGQTAPELIFSRLDATKNDLGLTTYKSNYPRKSDLKISKNYLDEKELNRLNLIVSGYLDAAEYQAETQTTMTMADWKEELDRYLTYQRADILEGRGSVSRRSANDKIDKEYEKYQIEHHEITKVDEDYFKALTNDIKHLKGNNNDR